MTIQIAPKIESSADAGGSIDPAGIKYVDYGSSGHGYAITPDDYYKIKDVQVDGSSIGAVSWYEFTNVTTDRTIHAEFEPTQLKIDYHTNNPPPTYAGQSGRSPVTYGSNTYNSDTEYNTATLVSSDTTYQVPAASSHLSVKGWHLQNYWTKTSTGGDQLANGTTGAVNIASALGENDNLKVRDVDVDVYAQWIINRGGVQLQKVDKDRGTATPQGDASLAGATYTITNRGPSSVNVGGTDHATDTTADTMTTGADGKAATANNRLPSSTYEIRETSASTGYITNSTWGGNFEIEADGTMVDLVAKFGNCPEQIIRGGIKVYKVDSQSNQSIPQGDAGTGGTGSKTFSGTVYEVKNMSTNPVYVNGAWYARGAVCATMTAGTDGYASLGGTVLPYGTYEVTEKTAVTGYLLNSAWKQTVQIRTNGTVVELTNDSQRLKDDVMRGGVKVEKYDYDTKENWTQGDANENFKGTKYGIYNKSEHYVYVDGTYYRAPTSNTDLVLVKTIETDPNNVAQTNDHCLPYGTYLIKEIEPVEGYLNLDLRGTSNPKQPWQKTFSIRSDGAMAKYEKTNNNTDNCNLDPVIRGGLTIQKVDAQSETNVPQGDAGTGGTGTKTFKDTTYEVKNLSQHAVYIRSSNAYTLGQANKHVYQPQEVCLSFKAGDNGIATLPTDTLPYGTYQVYESVAVNGYLVNNDWHPTFSIRSEAETKKYLTKNTPNESPWLTDNVKRGGVKVQKVDYDKQNHTTGYNLPQGDAGHMEDDGVTRTFKGTKYEIYNKSEHYVIVDGTSYRAPTSNTDLVLVKTIYADETGLAQTANDTLPYGTYLIREVTPAEGYLLDDWEHHYGDEGRWQQIFHIRPDASATDDHQVIDYTTKAKGWNDDPVMRGGITIYKTDADTDSTTPQGDAGKLTAGTSSTHSFAGTTYWIWNRSDYAVFIRDGHNMYKPELHTNHLYAKNEVCIEIVADENGIARTDLHALPYGSYLVQEVTPADGYENSNWSAEFQIRSEDQHIIYDDPTNDEGTIKNYEPVKRGGVSVAKEDADWGTPATQGHANRTFAGTEYTIYNKSDSYVYVDGQAYAPSAAVKVITADDTGVATTGNYSLPYGRYQIKETKAVEGYLLNLPGEDPWTRDFSINSYGHMQYYSKESNNTQVKDHVIRMGLEIHKVDKDTGTATPQGSAATLAGAKYVVTTLSPHDVYIKDTNNLGLLYIEGQHTYAYGERCAILTSGADGVASLPADTFPYGTYEVMEIEPPAGYLNSYWKHTFTVGENGIQDNGKTIVFDDADQNGKYPRNEEPIARGSVTVAKVDLETGSSIPQGDATLEGTVYEIKNMSGHTITIGNQTYDHGAVCMTITSDTRGVATTGDQELPYGTYDIYEKTPPPGYRNNGWYRTFTISRNGSNAAFVYSTGDYTKNEEPVERLKTGVQIRKVDADYQDESPSGSAGLGGAVFIVRNESQHPVMIGNSLRAVGDVVLRLTTDADGYAYILANTLPCGTYEVTEESAPTGYLRNSSWKGTLKVGTDGTPSFYEGDNPVDALVCPDPVIRGDLKFRKVAAGTNKGLPGIAFNIKSVTTGEEHIAITNENGLLDTSSSFASRENDSVNANDAAVSYANIDHIWVIDESALNTSNGIWFNGRKPGTVTPSNAVGALPYDTYEIEELRCDANRDYELVAPFRITVSSVGYAIAAETIEDPRLVPSTPPGVHGNRVTVYKDANPAPNGRVSPGDTITYTLLARNTGATTQRYTLVRDYIPTGTEYVAASVSNGEGITGAYATPDGGQSYVEWKIENLKPREERTLTFQVTVLLDAPQYLMNTAYSMETATDFTPGDPNNPRPFDESNTVMHRTGNTPTPAFVRVIKTSNPVPGTQVAWRSEIDYTLTVENTGGSTALLTGVYDKVPYGTELVSYTTEHVGMVSGTPGNQGVGWMVMVLEAGQSVELKMRVRVVDRSIVQSLGMVWNQASWGDLSNIDYPTTPTNDLSNTSNIVEHPLYEVPPETSDTYKVAEPEAESVVRDGDTVRYTLTTTNSLVSTKPYVLLRDYIPTNATYVDGSASDGGVYVPVNAEGNATGRAYVEWVLANVAPRASITTAFSVVVSGDGGSYVRNMAYSQTYEEPVTAGDPSNPEPSTRTNEVKHRFPERMEPEDLFPLVKIVKSSDPAAGSTVVPGQEMTYYLDVTNDGKATAYDVRVFDAAPLGTEVVSIPSVNNVQSTTASQVAGAGWLIKQLGIGESVRLSFTVRVTGEGGGEVVRNQARWAYENVPGSLAKDEPPVSPDGMTDESNVIEHRLSPGTPPQTGSYVTCYKDADPKPNSVVTVGDEIEYSIRAVNTGASSQDATLVRDYVPEGTTYVTDSATDGGVYVPASRSQNGRAYVEWVLGSLAPQETTNVSFKVKVTDGDRVFITNVALFDRCSPNTLPGDPDTPDPEDSSNTVWHTTDPTKPTPAVVQVVKSAEPPAGSEISRDDTVRYSLVVTNTGGSVAESYGVYDATPQGMVVIADSVSKEFSGRLSADGSYVAWLIDELAPGKSVTLSFEAKLADVEGVSTLDAVENQATWGPSDGIPEMPLENTSNIVEHKVGHTPSPILSKEFVGSPRVTVGDQMDFVIKVKNVGDAPMAGWSLVDIPPDVMSYLSDDSMGVLRDDGSIFWLINLNPGEEKTVTIRMTASSASAITGARNVAILNDEVGAISGMSTADVVIAERPKQAAAMLLQTGVGTVSGIVGLISASLLSYDLVKRRRMVA